MCEERVNPSSNENLESNHDISVELFNNTTAQDININGDIITAHTLTQIDNAQIETATVTSKQTNIKSATVYAAPPKIPSENIRWNVPLKSNHFVGRIELLKKIETYFNSDNNNNPLYLTACHGLGGVGKTQLAVEFCHRNNKKYKNIVWFSASTEEELIRQYINFAESESGLRILDKEDKRRPKEKAIDVKNWLQRNDEKFKEWLLVYDNALNNEAISDLLPNCGNVLITSRYTDWSGEKIPVDIFTLEESRDYIKKITGIENNPEIDILIAMLGRLPLALAQACAYIKRNKKSIGAYIKLYQERREALLASKLLPAGENHEPLAVTWNITLEEMKKESPESVELMYLCSQFYHENIPEYLLNQFFDNEMKADNAKRVAQEYSMVTVDEKNNLFSIHILVQEVIKIQLKKEEKLKEYLKKNIGALTESYSSDDTTKAIQVKKELLNHLQEALKNWDILFQGSLAEDDIIQLTFLHCHLIDAWAILGDEQKQIELLEKRTLPTLEKHFGKNHFLVALAQSALGNAYGKLGNAQQSKELIEQAFLFRLEKDPYINAKDLVNLGIVYSNLGDAKYSKKLLELGLSFFENHYGKNHYLVAETLINLGITYANLGDAQRSKELLERALIINENYYGKDHYKVSMTLFNLSNTYFDLGDIQRSKELLERTLIIDEKHYGNEHYMVARTLVNLSYRYGDLGDVKKKKKLLERALIIDEKHYGKNHYQVAIALGRLAKAYNALGDVQKQKELLERALIIDEKHYGKDHYKVSPTLANLGNTYGELGDAQKQKELLERVLTIEQNHHGNDPCYVANILNWLGYTYIELKIFKQAQLIFQKAFNIYNLYKHPDKKYPEWNLAHLPIREGNNFLLQSEIDVENAKTCYHQYENSPDPEKIETHQYFSSYFYKSNQLSACIEHFQIILKLDPQNSSTLHNLACMIHIKSQYEKIKENEKSHSKYLKEAEIHFENSIKLNAHTGVYTEYANFMLRNSLNYPIEKIINTLNKAMQLKQIDDTLSYGIMERITVDDNLKNLIDSHQEIQINAYFFSHYLLIQAYLRNNKIKDAKKIYDSFTSEKEKIIDKFENEKKSLLLAQELQPENADKIFQYLQTQELKKIFIGSLFKFSEEMIQATKNKLEPLDLEEDSGEELKAAIQLSLQKDEDIEEFNLEKNKEIKSKKKALAMSMKPIETLEKDIDDELKAAIELSLQNDEDIEEFNLEKEKDKKNELNVSNLYKIHGMLGKNTNKKRVDSTEKERLSVILAKTIFYDINAPKIEITLNEKEGLIIKFDTTIYDEKNIECIVKFLSKIEYKSYQFNCPVIQINNHTEIAHFVNIFLKGDAKLLYQEESLDFGKLTENEENCCVM